MDQDLLESHLNQFLEQLEKLNQAKSPYHTSNQDTLTSRCKELNDKMIKLDNDIEKTINKMSHESHHPQKIEPDNISINISIILNNYFHVLRDLEYKTLIARRRLEQLSGQGSNNV